MWREWCVRVGLWLARYGGWHDGVVSAPYIERVAALTRQVEARDEVARAQDNVIAELKGRMATAATVDAAILARAKGLTQDADTLLTGGEAKRHFVYARLIKDFPTTARRELALAIELALFQFPKEG